MHIGGGTNSAEEKAPFLRVLEAGEAAYLRCYRLVKEPLLGGTFGVDLLVTRSSRQAELRGVRQRLGGADFEDCMRAALGALSFEPPPAPTMLSYSFRFEVRDSGRTP
jgi:hypothetical protein